MTPAEKKELIGELSGAMAGIIDAKLHPVLRRLATLEDVDKDHARGIRDARVEVVRSKSEIKETTTESLLAASRHLASQVEAIRVDVTAIKATSSSIVPAAQGAERAAHRAEGKTDAVQIAANNAEANSFYAKKWAKIGPIVVVVAQIVAEIIRHVVLKAGS